MSDSKTNRQSVQFLVITGLCASLLFLVLAAGAGEAEGKTITVDDDGGEDYRTIPEALTEAESGDTIYVYSGTYAESVTVNKSIDLVGEDKHATIITSTVTITADGCKMSGFSFIPGQSYYGVKLFKANFNIISDNIFEGGGHGVHLDYSSHNTITNNTLERCCIYLSDHPCEHNTISNNSISGTRRYSIFLLMTQYTTLSNNKMVGGSINIIGGIENWNTLSIDTSNTVDGRPVRFYKNASGLTVPSGAGQVILANCTNMTVEDQNLKDCSYGVLLGFSSDNLIRNNTALNCSYAITLYDSHRNTFFNNSVLSTNLSSGINMIRCDYNTLSNNTVAGGRYSGIAVMGDFNIIVDNVIRDHRDSGISVGGSSNRVFGNKIFNITEGLGSGKGAIYLAGASNTVSNNTLVDNTCGITVSGSSMTVTGNRMTSCGLFFPGHLLEHWNTHTITTDNAVNGKPVRYYSNETDITVPSGAGQVIFANCSGMRVEDQDLNNGTAGILAGFSSYITVTNITVSNKVASDPESPYHGGIFLTHCDNNTISHCKVTGGEEGIYLLFSYHNSFFNNSIQGTGNHGIRIHSSDNNSFSNNSVSDCEQGIHLDSSCYNTLSGNEVFDNEEGVYLYRHCVWNTISNNTISGNEDHGINLRSYVDQTRLLNNTISKNGGGIEMSSSSGNNSAHYNDIYENDKGIDVRYDGLLNATNNWWGDKTGPYHSTTNSGGKGNSVSDGVVFKPWIDEDPWPDAFIDSISPNPALDTDTVVFNGSGEGKRDRAIERYVWSSSIDGELHNGSVAGFETDKLSIGVHTIFFLIQDSKGSWSEEASTKLTVNSRPEAKITEIRPDPAVEGEAVSFKGHGTATGGIERYVWSSSLDGELHNSSSEANFTSSKLSAGEHRISFKVMDDYEFWSEEANATLTVLKDSDKDGVPDKDDVFPNDRNEWADTDEDGVGDNSDAFPEDENEWVDSDEDGVGDNSDAFPEDENEWVDTDEDGVGDNSDVFPEDEAEWADTDEDGVGDNSDAFPEDENEWADTDQDGVGDNSDAFPEDENEWADSDEDGVGDNSDAFPEDGSEWADSDEDGIGDNSDTFPNDETEWQDTDQDGVGDNSDAFPTDPAASKDSDGDGYPDSWNPGKTAEDSTTDLKLDAYPDNPYKWQKEEDDSPGFGVFVVLAALVLATVAFSKKEIRVTKSRRRQIK